MIIRDKKRASIKKAKAVSSKAGTSRGKTMPLVKKIDFAPDTPDSETSSKDREPQKKKKIEAEQDESLARLYGVSSSDAKSADDSAREEQDYFDQLEQKEQEDAKLTPKKTSVWRKVLLFLIAVIAIAALSSFAYGYHKYSQISVRGNGGPSPTPSTSPVPETFNQGRTLTTLLMGYGGGGHQGGLLTDTMMLAIIDPESQTITLLSLPRDLWVELPVTTDRTAGFKINAAYAIGSDDKGYRFKPVEYTGPAGGGQLAKFAVKQATGLEVDKFITLNFSGFQKSIDVLGGVDVNVEKAFTDPVYPIEGKEKDSCGKTEEELQFYATQPASVAEKELGCRYEVLTFVQGMVHMDGTTALKYVRSRHSAQDGTDFGRAARQRNLIIAVREKMFRLDFFPKIIPFVNTLTADLKTDYQISDMQSFLEYRDELRDYKITSTALTEDNVLRIGRSNDGQSIVQPREGIGQWTAVHQWVKDELHRVRHPELATPSASPVTANGSGVKSGATATSSGAVPL